MDFLFLVDVSCVSLNLSEKRGIMDEQNCRNFLEEELFQGNFQLSFIKFDTFSCDIKVNCNISNTEGVNK